MNTSTTTSTPPAAETGARLRLWQLISPALPVGAYAYSQGLEQAVELGWVGDEASAGDWIEGLLGHSLAGLDVPLLRRLYGAWSENDAAAAGYWNRFLLSTRESRELRDEDRHLGTALARLLAELGLEDVNAWPDTPRATYAAMFSLAAVRWDIPLRQAAEGYLWAWCENQVAAAIKLIPLGQSAGQRLLSRLLAPIAAAVAHGLELADDDIGAVAPGLAMASAWHETQYTRLFRS
ncbi:MAG: urease accessory protein UreF [Gammaproteobacteria bacterium]